MDIVNKAEFMELPLGTIWSEVGTYNWNIKTGMRMGALALIDENCGGVDNIEWDCNYDVDYDDNSEFWVLEETEIEHLISKLESALKTLRSSND